MAVSTIPSPISMDDIDSRVDEQIDNKFGDDIGDNVTAWLSEHVTPGGSTVVVDDSLTIAGAAADAKKTGDEITGLKGALEIETDTKITMFVHGGYYIKTNVDVGSEVSLTPLTDAFFTNGGYAICNCSENDVFIINASGASAARLWAFIDSSNNLISKSGINTVANNLKLIAPKNAVKLIVNSTTAGCVIKGITPIFHNSLVGNLNAPIPFYQGTVSSTGVISPTSFTRIRTEFLDYDVIDYLKIKSTENYRYLLAFFDSNKQWISNADSWQDVTTNPIYITTKAPQNAKYSILVLRIGSGTDSISPTDIDEDTFLVYKVISTNYNYREIVKLQNEKQDVGEISPIKGSVNQISRIGWLPYTGKAPQQSIASYSEAYQNGCRIMLCDIRVTSDGKYVLWHDDDVSTYARNDDGTTISETLISTHTLAQMKALDFGIYKGGSYAGTRILALEELAKWCALVNCSIMLETKVQLTTLQVKEICDILKKHGLSYNTIIADDEATLPTTADAWIENLPRAMCCVRGGSRHPDNAFLMAKKFYDAGMRTMIGTTSTSTIDTYGDTWMEYGIMLEYSELSVNDDVDDFIDNGYIPKVSYIASSSFNINKYILRNYLGLL